MIEVNSYKAHLANLIAKHLQNSTEHWFCRIQIVAAAWCLAFSISLSFLGDISMILFYFVYEGMIVPIKFYLHNWMLTSVEPMCIPHKGISPFCTHIFWEDSSFCPQSQLAYIFFYRNKDMGLHMAHNVEVWTCNSGLQSWPGQFGLAASKLPPCWDSTPTLEIGKLISFVPKFFWVHHLDWFKHMQDDENIPSMLYLL